MGKRTKSKQVVLQRPSIVKPKADQCNRSSGIKSISLTIYGDLWVGGNLYGYIGAESICALNQFAINKEAGYLEISANGMYLDFPYDFTNYDVNESGLPFKVEADPIDRNRINHFMLMKLALSE